MYIEKQLDESFFEIRSGHEANPAAATGFTLQAPENCRSQLLALTFKLVTDANVANRLPTIRHIIGANPVYLSHALIPQTASTTTIWVAGYGHPLQINIDYGYGYMNLPYYPGIFEGDSLVIAVDNFQAADQISEIAYTWKRWLIP